MTHRRGMELTGIPQTEGLHHTHVDHNPHETANTGAVHVPGNDRFSEGKVRKMSGERV